jgi:hypothetical protein
MAFVAAVLRENLFAGLGVACGRRLALFSLRRRSLRAQRRNPENNGNYSDHGHSTPEE